MVSFRLETTRSIPNICAQVNGIGSYLGFQVLVTVLQAGYHVCASVDDQAQIDTIRSSDHVYPYRANLDLVIVPDVAAERSYDQALEDVVGVAHVVSSLSLPVRLLSEHHNHSLTILVQSGNHSRADIEAGVNTTSFLFQSSLFRAHDLTFPAPHHHHHGQIEFKYFTLRISRRQCIVLGVMSVALFHHLEHHAHFRPWSERPKHGITRRSSEEEWPSHGNAPWL